MGDVLKKKIAKINVTGATAIEKLLNDMIVETQCVTCQKALKDLTKPVLSAVSSMFGEQMDLVDRLTEIGLALSGETRLERLLEMIVDEARVLTKADAGTLYIVDKNNRKLEFSILQNDTMNVRMGGSSGNEITLPPVPLYTSGNTPNKSHVSAYCALTGETVNIADVYEAEGFDFTGPRKYDAATGYRSKSMLVLALKNHEQDIIGVLQLLNALDSNGKVVEFSTDVVDIVGSLASQAAIALTNAQLIQGLKDLLYSVIQSIAAAIDAKSPYTNGHIERVVDLTMMIAETVNNATEGKFADMQFTIDELEELKLAAWMHDVGKISIPEHVVDKSTKLQTIYDRSELVDNRFRLISELVKNRQLEEVVQVLSNGSGPDKISAIEMKYAVELEQLEDDRKFIASCNIPNEFMTDERIARVCEIAARTYESGGESFNWLSDDEVTNLCIRKGTLTDRERKVIESHAAITFEMLSRLPFPKRLLHVPEYAAGHHEKIDGSGYPKGLAEKELSLQSRIMAVADIFEALTAKDRPYKKPMKLAQAIKILGFMEKDRHIDSDVYKLFLDSGIYMEYAKAELDPSQIEED
ncbi:HD-GYP domain, c-di-GMP phosphodiesterase class II (or its inactivated variant) [Maridesulfovibrio ferrireducens]|uniref:HD-GYP domain, c-di-GMP phosphodiesterase class II (Or its inactivated variant) n=1 Tax=Maridesulfovibrio ferrireducens TaxID=246191 RepID=A0A1G9F2I7_9BACT|nr:HD-GYP domain, c-di-GMP phosphodiesterase class II (or its inactivated variant) [Maridesulfovibrio ferrireducens]